MSQENERLLAFAARVLDAQQAPPLLDSSTDVLSAPYPASRWHLTAPTPAGVLRKGTKRKIKADSLATRSQLRRYFIQLLLHRRAVEKMLELGEIQIPGHREALIVQLQGCTRELYTVGQRLLASTPAARPTAAAGSEGLVPRERNDGGSGV